MQSVLLGDLSPLDEKIKSYRHLFPKSTSQTYISVLQYVYKILEKKYPNEYIYKNTFLNERLLIEKCSPNSVIFSEFRIGKSIADLAQFNGISKVFEIKTELDSPSRLQGQLTNYKQVFNQVYLIIPESKLDLYKDFDSEIGLITFNQNYPKLERFKNQRESITFPFPCATQLMEVLHTQEYKNIVSEYFTQMPDMNSFNQFKICTKLLDQIPRDKLNQLFIKQIKLRDPKCPLSKHAYKELNQISLALKFKPRDKNLLVSNLKQTLKY